MHHITEEKNEEKFICEFNSQDVDKIVFDKEHVNETIGNYLQNLSNLLEKHAPFKKMEQAREKVSTKAFDHKRIMSLS